MSSTFNPMFLDDDVDNIYTKSSRVNSVCEDDESYTTRDLISVDGDSDNCSYSSDLSYESDHLRQTNQNLECMSLSSSHVDLNNDIEDLSQSSSAEDSIIGILQIGKRTFQESTSITCASTLSHTSSVESAPTIICTHQCLVSTSTLVPTVSLSDKSDAASHYSISSQESSSISSTPTELKTKQSIEKLMNDVSQPCNRVHQLEREIGYCRQRCVESSRKSVMHYSNLYPSCDSKNDSYDSSISSDSCVEFNDTKAVSSAVIETMGLIFVLSTVYMLWYLVSLANVGAPITS